MDTLYTLGLHEALTLLKQGEITSLALTESVLGRIEAVEPRVKAYLVINAEKARDQARIADQDWAKGRARQLCGLPLGIKDLLCTTDFPTTCGSRMLENFIAPYEATVVEKLRQAGAVILGKQAMDEFAMGSTSETCAFQTPENPWKAGRICGGSSGGSAAAVAADECLASLGSDTGGSIRQPASLCGVVGLKPSYGRVSRYGLVAFASSLDQIGPFTKNVRDCALMMQVIAGFDHKDSTSATERVPDFSTSLTGDVKGLTIGIPKEYFTEGLDAEVEKSVRAGIAALKASGAKVVDVSLPHTQYCVAAYYLIAPAEASSNLARFDGVRYGFRQPNAENLLEMFCNSRALGFGNEVKRRILIGTYALSAGYYDAYYKKASLVRALIRQDFDQAFQQCDLIASPVCPLTAWQIGAQADNPLALYLSDVLTISANLAGIPALSVPCGFSHEGMPIGIQLQAAHFNEEVLLRAGYALERQLNLNTIKPQL